MNDDEKTFEAFRMTDRLCELFDRCRHDVVEKFKKGTIFPYFQRVKATDDKGNEWTLLYYILTKAMKKKGRYYTLAYTIYEIPRRRKENDVNAGKGIMLFDPFAMRDRINNVQDCRPGIIIDIVPHAFNRYTERYLKPMGIEGMEFPRKIENMLTRWQWFDIEADLCGDKNAAKHKGDNICPYDVIMRGGGLLRGQIVQELLLRFTTYVSQDMLFDNQIEQYEKMQREYYRSRRDGIVI